MAGGSDGPSSGTGLGADAHEAPIGRLMRAFRSKAEPVGAVACGGGLVAASVGAAVKTWRARDGAALLSLRDDPVVRTNRAVALAEVEGPAAALLALDRAPAPGWLPFHAARADLLARLGRGPEAVADYDAALALGPSPAESLFLKRRRAASVAP